MVIVDKGLVVPYDHLVITCGLQYQTPNPSLADVDETTNHKLPVNPRNPNNRCVSSAIAATLSCNCACCRYFGPEMKNVFVINDEYDSAVCLYWLENNILKDQKGVAIHRKHLLEL